MKSVLHTRTAIAAALLLGLTACGDTASPAEEDAPAAAGSSTASAPAGAEEETEADEPEQQAGGTAGTREDPLPLGTPIEGEDWVVTVNEVTPDATDAVMAANQFNDAPAEGTQYLLADVTVEYTGDESEMIMLGTGFAFVTATGETIDAGDAFAVGPEELDTAQELYNGGTAQGNVVLQVPEGADGLLRVTTGMFGGEKTFVALD
ncbi:MULTISPECIES: DUF4352 domain-containing protein [Micrococcus]|uniref:DUF4352 domain-containing protein n=1 Tax=Micrococcus TaxID=1269 RepID=UPI001E59C2E7|nr:MULTISPECIES: DUF4352 domain-containing protein [Micrococcus]MCD0173099.1 DUF4352 domain-containing protein [Micrococcus luteus]MCV7742320.1 DUF4352 domain-containing protein [Micrococcus luteus]URI29054.1 DUF4352 domain-containing protein [Micrococcus yunnanensis]